MSKLLSQDEVDALLKGMEGGEVATEPEEQAAPPSEVRPVDFGSTERSARLGLPTFETVNERFALVFQDSLGAFVRRKAEFLKTGTELLRFEDFLRSLVVPTSLHVFRPLPLRGNALLVLGSHFVFNVVEIFFGGKGGSEFKIEGRDFTAIEQQLIGKLVEVALKDFAKAWEGVHPVQAQLVRSEINPAFAKVIPADENVVVTTYRADLHNAAGQMQVCIPISTLEPIRGVLSQGFQSGAVPEVDRTWQERLGRRLREVPVEMVVELGRGHITSRRLLELKPGDVITLDNHTADPVVAAIGGVPKLSGFVGLTKGAKAFQVSGPY